MSEKEYDDLLKVLDENYSVMVRLRGVDNGVLFTGQLPGLFSLNLDLDMGDSDDDNEKVDLKGFDCETSKSFA